MGEGGWVASYLMDGLFGNVRLSGYLLRLV